MLSSRFTAAQVYYAYLHLDIIAVKRWKGPAKSEHSRTHYGMAKAGTSATALKRHFPWKDEIVSDYSRLKDATAMVPTPNSPEWLALLSEALRHLHARILQDISPPFLARACGAQTGDSLHAYSRATFLYWDGDKIAQVFGAAIVSDFQRRAGAYHLELAGILGRPLYACGAVKPDSGSWVNLDSSDLEPNLEQLYCNNVASMSPLLRFRNEQQLWKCASCAALNADANTSRRVLHLYPLVRTTAQKMTPLRSRPAYAALHPPPSEFEWSQNGGTLAEGSLAVPRHSKNFAAFSAPESRVIWLTSATFI